MGTTLAALVQDHEEGLRQLQERIGYTFRDLQLLQLEEFGPSYARTLQAWRERFMARLPEVRAQGFDARFVRMWEFYLAYCEGGFRERSIGVAHLLLGKPGHVRAQGGAA